jgi:ComF family protein
MAVIKSPNTFRILQHSLSGLQSALHGLFPPQCLTCDAQLEPSQSQGLCAECWGKTPFIAGLVCDQCGCALPGADSGQTERCDDCMVIARPWSKGRAVLQYSENGRKIVLAYKHADRLDMLPFLGRIMVATARPLISNDTLIVPVPAHWTRRLSRRYDQAVLLAKATCQVSGSPYLLDALIRKVKTGTQDGLGRDARFANVSQAFIANPKRMTQLQGRKVLLIDDVMTSGATFAAAAEVCLASGATEVSILSLARVAKDD